MLFILLFPFRFHCYLHSASGLFESAIRKASQDPPAFIDISHDDVVDSYTGCVGNDIAAGELPASIDIKANIKVRATETINELYPISKDSPSESNERRICDRIIDDCSKFKQYFATSTISSLGMVVLVHQIRDELGQLRLIANRDETAQRKGVRYKRNMAIRDADNGNSADCNKLLMSILGCSSATELRNMHGWGSLEAHVEQTAHVFRSRSNHAFWRELVKVCIDKPHIIIKMSVICLLSQRRDELERAIDGYGRCSSTTKTTILHNIFWLAVTENHQTKQVAHLLALKPVSERCEARRVAMGSLMDC